MCASHKSRSDLGVAFDWCVWGSGFRGRRWRGDMVSEPSVEVEFVGVCPS